MGIPSHIREARNAVRTDERINKKRSSFVRKFGDLLNSNRDLNLKLKTSQIAILQRVFEYGIQFLEERIVMACARAHAPDLGSVGTTDLERNMKETEYLLMAKFLNDLETEENPDYDDEIVTRETGIHVVHQTLSELHGELVYRLDTRGTLLLDHLAKYDIITESDEENIREPESGPERNRRLLSVLSTVPPSKNMKPFVDFLKHHHRDLGERVEESIMQLAGEPPDHLCAACTVVTMVDPRLIAKTMFERRHIPTTFYSDLINPNIPTDMKWKMIRRNGLEEEAIHALKPKFTHYFNMFTREKDLTCTCRDSEVSLPVKPGRGESSGRNSGTSSFKRWSEKASRNVDNEEVINELQKLRSSVEDLGRILHNPRGREIEVSNIERATSTQNISWSYQPMATPLNRFSAGSAFDLRTRWDQSQFRDNGERVTRTKRKNIFSKLKNRFSISKSSVT